MALDCTPFEKQIIEGCAKGNERSQEMLYKHFYGYAMGICRRYASGREEASIILNDSFLKVFRQIRKEEISTSFRGWLRKIIINTAIDYFRSRLKFPQHVPLEEAGLDIPNVQNALDTLEAEDILQLLQALPGDYRLVFVLYVV